MVCKFLLSLSGVGGPGEQGSKEVSQQCADWDNGIKCQSLTSRGIADDRAKDTLIFH